MSSRFRQWIGRHGLVLGMLLWASLFLAVVAGSYECPPGFESGACRVLLFFAN